MPVPVRGEARLRRAERFERADYRRVFDEGRSYPARYFVLWVAQATGGAARFGAVVSKRTFPLAVQRNRARRLMREAYRLSKGGLMEGFHLMLLGRRRLVDSTTRRDDIIRDFASVCRRAGVWKGGAR